MEMGSELSKTVATFIVQKILLDNVRLTLSRQRWPCLKPVISLVYAHLLQVGLNYICATAERFFAVSAVLNSMVQSLSEAPSVRLLKHIIRCYLRLSDNSRAREALRQCLPGQLLSPPFTACLKEDTQTRM